VQIGEHELGPMVREVFPNTGAAKSGLKANDIIVKVAGVRTPGRVDLLNALGRNHAGDEVVLEVVRGKEELQVKVMLSPRQSVFPMNPRASLQNSLGGALSGRRDGFTQVLQHDTVLTPERCGGPLLDLAGRAVGINIARAGRVESYAIPAPLARAVADRLIRASESAATAKPATPKAPNAPTPAPKPPSQPPPKPAAP
jgi:serine protease Do